MLSSLEVDASTLMKLDQRYTLFLGGLPDSAAIIPDSVATKAPYIGCMRDVLVVPKGTDFNEVSYKTGVELGTCKSEMPQIGGNDCPSFPLNCGPPL